jgi:tRNA(fMet)-specific endonuclease VapC
MIILDTDHLTEYQRKDSAPGARLRDRLRASANRPVVATIISVEEQLRGRLAGIRHQKSTLGEVTAYGRLLELITFFAGWGVLPLDPASAQRCDSLKKQKIRIGPMDRKIASIALTHDATLLSANLRDFQQVPGLRVEDWLRA